MSVFENLKKYFAKNNCTIVPEVYKSGASKFSLTAGCTMELTAGTEQKKKEIDAHLKQLVKKYIETPEKLIQYMTFKGAEVYKIKNAEGVLSFFGEEEGFIPPAKGLKAAVFYAAVSYISSGKIQIKFNTPEMAVFDADKLDIYKIARALHKFTGCKNHLPGFDSYSQALFKKIYGARRTKYGSALIDNASLKDIYACRDALARDLESINFTVQLSLEYSQSKKTLEKIKKDKNAKI